MVLDSEFCVETFITDLESKVVYAGAMIKKWY